MLSKFKLGRNVTRATKNDGCAKGEGIFDHITVTNSFKKYLSCFKKLAASAKSDRPLGVDSEVVVQVIDANPVWSACHCPMIFATLKKLSKISSAAELGLTLRANS